MTHDEAQDHHDTHKGLRTPAATALSFIERPTRGIGLHLIRIATLLLSIAMLVWVVRLAVTSQNREQLTTLLSRGWGTLIIVLALSSVTLFFNGVMFWLVVKPLQKLPFWHVQRVNAAGTMAAPLPYKMSMIIRFSAHHKIDGMPFTQLFAWFASFGVLMLTVALPLTVVSLSLESVNQLWWILSSAGVLAAMLCLCFVMRWSLKNQKLRKLTLNSGHMLGHWPTVWQTTLVRLLDMISFGARFWLVSKALDAPMAIDQVVLATSVFLIAGMLAPSGTLGIREGAVAGIGFLPGALDTQLLASVTLVVSASEIATATLFGSVSLLWLKPWKILSRRRA
jgi:lysylphosphatidylglycerol synthase-like protein